MSVSAPAVSYPEIPDDSRAPWVERREIGPCTLILGDSRALLAAGEIPEGAAIVSDPPYGIGFKRGAGGLSSWARETPSIQQREGDASKIVGDDEPFELGPWLEFSGKAARGRRHSSGPIVGSLRIAVLGADAFCDQVPPGQGAWYTWDKSAGGGPNDSYTDAEYIWMSARSARRVYRHQWKGRLRAGDTEPRYHVAQKPVALMAWIIETVRAPVGSLVCDPYMGSGSTGIACMRTGRRFFGVEKVPSNYRIACERIERAWAKMQDSAA